MGSVRFFCRAALLLPMLCVVLGSGCATQQVRKPIGATTLMVARGDGKATLQWKSDPGILYTVMYAPRRSSGVRWTSHPRYRRIRGTGQTITIEDQIPRGQPRHYRLHIEPAY
jgi:hypothetical protein